MNELMRTLAELVAAGEAALPPATLDDASIIAMAQSGEAFTVVDVDHTDVETYGGKWGFILQLGDGSKVTCSFWENQKRDELSTYLMQAVQRAPVPGVRFVNDGSPKRPFIYMTAA